MDRRTRLWAACLVASAGVACAKSAEDTGSIRGAYGGTSGNGGGTSFAGAGGKTSVKGTGGASGADNVSATGGTGTGGTGAGGGTGGSNATGGASGTGGTSATGGDNATGGAVGTAGNGGTGGNPTGGSTGTGGTGTGGGCADCAPVTILPPSALGRVPGATGGPTQGHLVYARNTRRWWFFTWSGVPLTSGTATGGDTGQLIDSSKSWTAGQFRGQSCYLTGGTGAGETFEIGPNGSNSLPVQNNGTPWYIQTAPANGTTYEVIDTRHVRAYVSSGADLGSATWTQATNGISPETPNNTGIDVTGGRNDGGGFGEYPTDGRLLSVAYADVNGVDVVLMLTQQNLHWMKLTERARLGIGSASTIAWDLTGPVTWDDGFPGNECAPTFLQGLAVGISSTLRWHALQIQNFFGLGGYPSGVLDDGSNNRDMSWGGTRGTFDSTIGANAHQAALAALASGYMLAVYVNGTRDPGFGAVTHQTGLRYVESSSESGWSTSNIGKLVPNLSNATQHPNDWCVGKVSDSDIHVVRRNSATVLEEVRYSGHGGSWGSKVTLPSGGLTGQQAGSGVALASDGTGLWAFVIDTDSGHSVKYLKWMSASGWASTWTALPKQDGSPKSFLVATYGNGQIGIAWTVGGGSPYSVAVAQLPTAP